MEEIREFMDICTVDKTLRPYQQKAKQEIFNAWDYVDNVMFQMPTGTGKTRLFTSIIKDINEYWHMHPVSARILVVAHRAELIDQISRNLTRYSISHNTIASGKRIIHPFKVNVYLASIQTLTHPANISFAKTIDAKFVIIDEAHHALAATYKKLWDLYPHSRKLGVTATPWRLNHSGFIDLFDKLVLSMSVKQFIEQGYLSTYKYFSIKSNSYVQHAIDRLDFDKFGDYKESSMEEKMDIGSIRAQLLSSYKKYANGKKGIVYAINIAHANHICEEYKKIGLTAVSIDSKTPASERERFVQQFKDGDIDIIVNVDIFSEGFDCPDIEFIQLARPTRSLVKYLQQVGRGLRKVEGKDNCVILDNVGMYVRFGLPDANRHWRYHFSGHEISEAPTNRSVGTGLSREVDMSEGDEDMVLIQDVEDDYDTSDGHNDVENRFDPIPDLLDLGYENPDFVFWQQSTKKIYECYIEDNRQYIINELIIDTIEKKITRIRIGQIPLQNWMSFKLMSHSVSGLATIKHHGGFNSEFHFNAMSKENGMIVKSYNFFGEEMNSDINTNTKISESKDDMVNVPVQKAYHAIVLNDKQWDIYRLTSLRTEKIAEIEHKSDFGLMLQRQWTSAEISAAFSGKKYGKLHFNIYKSDQNSIYVKTKENDCDYYFKYDFKGKKLKKYKIVESPDVWSALFDGKESFRELPKEKKHKTEENQNPSKDKSYGEKIISLSVRQATFERIDDGRKKSVSRAMTDESIAKNFFVFNGEFKLKKKTTAYTPSFTKVIEDTCPFVPIDYKFVEIKAEGIQRTIIKGISDISVKKSLDVKDKYNWVITYTFE